MPKGALAGEGRKPLRDGLAFGCSVTSCKALLVQMANLSVMERDFKAELKSKRWQPKCLSAQQKQCRQRIHFRWFMQRLIRHVCLKVQQAREKKNSNQAIEHQQMLILFLTKTVFKHSTNGHKCSRCPAELALHNHLIQDNDLEMPTLSENHGRGRSKRKLNKRSCWTHSTEAGPWSICSCAPSFLLKRGTLPRHATAGRLLT